MKLTTSEARAEACTIVLKLLLVRLPKKTVAKMHEVALEEAGETGHHNIVDEVDWLFHETKI